MILLRFVLFFVISATFSHQTCNTRVHTSNSGGIVEVSSDDSLCTTYRIQLDEPTNIVRLDWLGFYYESSLPRCEHDQVQVISGYFKAVFIIIY